jgi:hypothetical protein
MSTPTEVHLDLALQIAEALARSGNVAAAELIAASEARATAELRDSLAIGQDNCNDAYDELATDCAELRGDVVRLTAERDQLRAENATLRAAQKACEACDEPTAFEVRQLRAELAAERARSPGPRLAPESPTEMRPN